jgi:hypothetical protein
MASVSHVVIRDNVTITKHAVIGFIIPHKQICSLPVGSSHLVLDVTARIVYRNCVVGLDVEPQERFTASHTLHSVPQFVRCALQIILQDRVRLCTSDLTNIHI